MHTWDDCWNDVIRYELFPDKELKEAMAIPDADKNNIQLFRDKYFVQEETGDRLITDDKVRV